MAPISHFPAHPLNPHTCTPPQKAPTTPPSPPIITMAGVETPLPGLAEEEQFIEEYDVMDGGIPELEMDGQQGMPAGMEASPEMQAAQGCVWDENETDSD
jgi:hypothetical protein